VPFLVHPKVLLPENATSLGASPSLGGTTKNVTPWFFWMHQTLKNTKNHLNKHFHFLKNKFI